MQNEAAAYQAKQQARTFAAAQLAAANPHLIPVSTQKCSRIAATKNIRIELKRAFPGVKFSVTSDTFSMGDSISIRWTDGPTTSQVETITDKYSAGRFDGSTDYYEYTRNAWTDAFGDAKYVHATREYSDAFTARIVGRVCRWLGGVDRSAEQAAIDYKAGRLWNVTTAGGCDLSREIGLAMQRHTCCIDRTPKA